MCSTIDGICSYLKDNAQFFNRTAHPSIRRALNGFIKNRPSEKRPKKPFMDAHLHFASKYLLNNKKSYNAALLTAALCLGYWHGMRPGEYTIHSRTKPGDILTMKNQYFGPQHSNIDLENIIILHGSKTNRIYKKEEILPCSCSCRTHFTLPCSMHAFKHYFKLRKETFNKILKHEPLLMTENKKALTSEKLNNFIKNVIILMNEKLNLKLTTNGYAAHSLRVGSCTDKMRQGWTENFVKKWGRWSSDIWHKTYWTLDLRDFCAITKVPLDTVFTQEYKIPCF